MRVNAIICEYNPFHNGHRFQIEKIRKKSNNPIVAIMSGNFTQRGDVAIADKFTRAETAVKNGVDLVLELPTVFACSSAKNFSRAGVNIANALGCTENLCFSVEDDDFNSLKEISEAFEDKAFNAELNRLMKEGSYYPQAVELTLNKLYSNRLGEIIKKPNNILAVEYINALKNTDIKPLVIKRAGAGHDSDLTFNNFSSASNIRDMILSGRDCSPYIPENSPAFSDPADIKKLEKIIIYKLRAMDKEEIKNLPDVSEGLHNRIYNSVRNYNSLDEILANIKTKRYTLARIRRIIISSLLNITKYELKREVSYLRVLAFNEKGAEILSGIKKNGKLPLITNVADGYKNLDAETKKIFEIDLLASDIYSLATDRIKECGEDFIRPITVIKEKK